MFNFETCPTFYGSLTNVEFSRFGHFLRNYMVSQKKWTFFEKSVNPLFIEEAILLELSFFSTALLKT